MKLFLCGLASYFAGMTVFLIGGWIALASIDRYFYAWSDTARGLYLTLIGVVSLASGICLAIYTFRQLRKKHANA